jgi:hypothetical protein
VNARIILEELNGVSERPMIIPMPTTARLQQRHDHRLRAPIQRLARILRPSSTSEQDVAEG